MKTSQVLFFIVSLMIGTNVFAANCKGVKVKFVNSSGKSQKVQWIKTRNNAGKKKREYQRLHDVIIENGSSHDYYNKVKKIACGEKAQFQVKVKDHAGNKKTTGFSGGVKVESSSTAKIKCTLKSNYKLSCKNI